MYRSSGLLSCAVTLVALGVPAASWAAPGLTSSIAPPPTVASINPTHGSTSGSTTVTIKGTGFEEGATVRNGAVVVADTSGTSSTGPEYRYQEECAGTTTTETTGKGSATKSATRSVPPGSG